jgi:hypothetical protein
MTRSGARRAGLRICPERTAAKHFEEAVRGVKQLAKMRSPSRKGTKKR